MGDEIKKQLNAGRFIQQEKITIKVKDENGKVIHKQTIISKPGDELFKNILDVLNPKKE